MNKLNKVLSICAVAIMGAFSANAQQDSSASATVTATVVQPIAIAKVNDMSFGKFSVGTAGGGTVTLVASSAGTRNVGGGITLPADAGTVTASQFTVTGASSYGFTVTLSGVPVTMSHSSTADELIVSDFKIGDGVTSTAVSGATFSLSSGTKTLYVGATLTADEGDDPGDYTADAPFSVTVNYN